MRKFWFFFDPNFFLLTCSPNCVNTDRVSGFCGHHCVKWVTSTPSSREPCGSQHRVVICGIARPSRAAEVSGLSASNEILPEWQLPAGSLSCLHMCRQVWARLMSVPVTEEAACTAWDLMPITGHLQCSPQGLHGHLLGMPVLLSLKVGTPYILNIEPQLTSGVESKLDFFFLSMRLKLDILCLVGTELCL